MKKMLITGGTVFVSRYMAEYFRDSYDVYVLNRNTKPQSKGVTLIEGDRHDLGEKLREYHFDVVLDTAYTGDDVNSLLDALGGFDNYILISSSAVYPEWADQPFTEETAIGPNKIWGVYGTNKIAAEEALLSRVPGAYVLRSPYLYGPMDNVYREAFVFDCALEGRKFYLPKDGGMKLQFFHVKDLCRFVAVLLDKQPEQHVFNVGNAESVTIREWVELCYQAAGKRAEFFNVSAEVEQRCYFPFYNYEYYLDVQKQSTLMPETVPLAEGLKEAYAWYVENGDKVYKKPYFAYIEANF